MVTKDFECSDHTPHTAWLSSQKEASTKDDSKDQINLSSNTICQLVLIIYCGCVLAISHV